MKPSLVDTIRLIEPIPNENLDKGATGTIVDEFLIPTEAYLVEFCNEYGETVSLLTLYPNQFEIERQNIAS